MSSFKQGESKEEGQAGVIEEVLPRGMYRVRLESGRVVRVGLPPTSRHSIVRLISGDRVLVAVSNHDPSRGHVIKKL